MKTIAILDMIEMPTVCKECRFREGELKGDDLVWLCHLNDEYVELNAKSDYCPLRPLPDKKPVSYHDDLYGDVEKNYTNIGWNLCIDEIMGEKE